MPTTPSNALYKSCTPPIVARPAWGFALLALSFSAQSAVLEEVTVTAQKREQSLQDVPIAIHAIQAEDMRSDGIEKLEALAPTIPSFHVSEAFGGDQVFLRGLGPGVNTGFEQAVGQVVDGFFYGRSRFSRLQFLDLERVEVLKGPQGAIIGKNTTAGAINITTAKPTDELEGWVTGGYEFEGAEGATIEGAVSGPISDTVAARLALRYEDKDGFLNNSATGTVDQGRDDFAGRLSVRLQPTDNFNALLQYAHADVKRKGRNIQTIVCTPAYRLAVPEEDCTLNDKRHVADVRAGQPGFESQDTEADTYGITLNWESEEFTLSSLTGYAEYSYVDAGVASYSDIETFMIDIGEEYEQLSQEFRIVSNGTRSFDYIAGLYYLDHELISKLDLHITRLGPNTINRTRNIEPRQDGKTWAAFGQLVFHLNEQWDATLEGRYTKEDKDGRSVQFPTLVYTDIRVPGPGAGGPAGVFNVHDVSGERSESNFSPGAVITWKPTDNAMYYASARKGFKGGGFDHQLSAPQAAAMDGRFQFEEEEVLSFELGGKLTLADGAARLNFSVFHNKYDDLQVSALTGPTTFTVGNAASATTKGAEADLLWQPTEALTLAASLALLDAKYDDFPGASCSFFQTSNGLCPAGTQDLSGKPLQFSPDYSYNVSATYVQPMSDRLQLAGVLRVYGEADKELAQDLDPNTVQESYTKVDARLTLEDVEGRWSIALIGRNLTNKETIGFANDINLFRGSYWGMTESLRSFSIQGTLRF